MIEGLCECGCGDVAPIAKKTRSSCGHVKGQSVRFINYHAPRVRSEETSAKLAAANRAGRKTTSHGYIRVYRPDADGPDASGYVYEHRLVMAEIIGRPLTADEQVHHVNEDKADNASSNLWLFPDAASHRHWHGMARDGLTIAMAAVQLPVD